MGSDFPFLTGCILKTFLSTAFSVMGTLSPYNPSCLQGKALMSLTVFMRVAFSKEQLRSGTGLQGSWHCRSWGLSPLRCVTRPRGGPRQALREGARTRLGDNSSPSASQGEPLLQLLALCPLGSCSTQALGRITLTWVINLHLQRGRSFVPCCSKLCCFVSCNEQV